MVAVLENKLLIEPEEAPEKIGSVLLTDFSRRTPVTAKVLRVGPEVEIAPLGSVVVYNPTSGQKVEIGGKKLLIITENDIEAIITEKADGTSDLEPAPRYVLVEEIDQTEQVVNGLIIPVTLDTATHQEGTVITVGMPFTTEQGAKVPSELSDGQKIAYRKGSGLNIKLDTKDYLLVSETDIYGVIE